MILADMPAPTSVQVFGWISSFAALLLIWNQFRKAIDREKGEAPHPPNTQLGQSVADLTRRVSRLEEQHDELVTKLEDDKLAILAAGEKRAVDIHTHIETDVRNINSNLAEMPDRIIAMLKNTGAIK